MRTLLYSRHVALGAKIVPFSGWDMPLYYQGTVAEHMAVRNRAGLFDVSHMGRIDIEGEEATAMVEFLCTNRLVERSDRTTTYAVMCHPSGGAIDDTLVYRISATHYFIVANAANRDKDLQHLINQSRFFGCIVTPMFDEIGILALQGPQAVDIIEEVFQQQISLHAMQFTSLLFKQAHILIAHTGYTGSSGYEFFVSLDHIGDFWDTLLQAKCAPDLLPCGLAARDTLRLEAGYALYGHELSDDIAPTESVSAWAVNWKKRDFIGKDALVNLENSPNKRSQHGIRLLEAGVARAECPVWKGHRQLGVVTSGTFSPCLNCGIALVMVTETLAIGEVIEVEIRGRKIKAEVVKVPFIRL